MLNAPAHSRYSINRCYENEILNIETHVHMHTVSYEELSQDSVRHAVEGACVPSFRRGPAIRWLVYVVATLFLGRHVAGAHDAHPAEELRLN